MSVIFSCGLNSAMAGSAREERDGQDPEEGLARTTGTPYTGMSGLEISMFLCSNPHSPLCGCSLLTQLTHQNDTTNSRPKRLVQGAQRHGISPSSFPLPCRIALLEVKQWNAARRLCQPCPLCCCPIHPIRRLFRADSHPPPRSTAVLQSAMLQHRS